MNRLFWKVYLPLAACVILTLIIAVVGLFRILPEQIGHMRESTETFREFLTSSPDLRPEDILARAGELDLDVRVEPRMAGRWAPPVEGYMGVPGLPENYPFDVAISLAPRGGPGGFIRQSFWLVLLLLLLTEGLVLYLALWPLRKRLDKLRWAASELGAGNLRVRLSPSEPGDLIDSLGATFNLMAGEMETLLASHRELLGIVAHELRTPLARMQLALELIREDIAEGNLSKVERMERDLASLDLLVSELLTFNRLGRTGELRSEEVRLSDLCREAADAESWTRDGISMEVSGDAAVLGDRALLGRAIANLVRNAAAHARSKVEITVSAEPEGGASVTVSDDGPGYDSSLLGRLGEPFVKGGSKGGTGLGLAIASRIAVLHSGRLSFGVSPSLGGAEAELSLKG
jgi:signal transduction histidine kinase